MRRGGSSVSVFRPVVELRWDGVGSQGLRPVRKEDLTKTQDSC